MSDEKMRAEFEKAHEHIYRQFDCRHSGNYTNSFIQAKWEAWKACAAIKDAEIASLKNDILGHENNMRAYESIIGKKTYREVADEIAARDLMIKELCEFIADTKVWFSTETMVGRGLHDKAESLLAKSEHHNSRALEKMLLEARIEELQFADEGYDARTYARLCRLKTELAELNKE